jgi:hypothetical protein
MKQYREVPGIMIRQLSNICVPIQHNANSSVYAQQTPKISF